jgi:3-oxoacyl-[acyl-carrier-protein] synthase III
LPDTYIKAEDVYLKKYDRETTNMMLKSGKLDRISVIQSRNEIILKHVELLEDLLQKTQIDPLKVKYIIYTDKPTYITGNCICIPYYLQERFGMKNASTFLVYQNCSSVFQTLDLMNSMYDDQSDYYTIVLSTAYMKGEIEERETLGVIIGDGLGIMLVGPNEKKGYRIIDTVTKSYGNLSYQNDIYNPINKLNMETRIKTLAGVIQFISEFIKKNNMTAADIKKIVPQSLDIAINQTLASFLKVPFERVFSENISKCGHLAAVDIIQNIHDVINSGEIGSGDYFLGCGVGIDQSTINSGCFLCMVE